MFLRKRYVVLLPTHVGFCLEPSGSTGTTFRGVGCNPTWLHPTPIFRHKPAPGVTGRGGRRSFSPSGGGQSRGSVPLTKISGAISANPLTGVDESTRIVNGTAISQETLTVIDEVKGFQQSATDSSVKDGIGGVVNYLMMFGVWVLTPSQPQPDSSMLSGFSSACQPFTGAPSAG